MPTFNELIFQWHLHKKLSALAKLVPCQFISDTIPDVNY